MRQESSHVPNRVFGIPIPVTGGEEGWMFGIVCFRVSAKFSSFFLRFCAPVNTPELLESLAAFILISVSVPVAVLGHREDRVGVCWAVSYVVHNLLHKNAGADNQGGGIIHPGLEKSLVGPPLGGPEESEIPLMHYIGDTPPSDYLY